MFNNNAAAAYSPDSVTVVRTHVKAKYHYLDSPDSRTPLRTSWFDVELKKQKSYVVKVHEKDGRTRLGPAVLGTRFKGTPVVEISLPKRSSKINAFSSLPPDPHDVVYIIRTRQCRI